MLKVAALLVTTLIATACEDRLADQTEEAAERVTKATEADERAAAQHDFEQLRALRVAALRAEHSVAASQPLLIQVIANEKSLSPVLRARLDENLAIFRLRLAHAREAIDKLQYVNAMDWERSDDEVGRVMAGMFIARDASWHVIDDTPERDDTFPET